MRKRSTYGVLPRYNMLDSTPYDIFAEEKLGGRIPQHQHILT